MGQHSTRLGDLSTSEANLKQKKKFDDQYVGRHRKDVKVEPLGDRNRVSKKDNEFESGRNANDRDRTDK